MQPVVQIMNESYKESHSLYCVTRYVTHDKEGRPLRYCGSPNTRIDHIADDMMFVKRYFGKEHGRLVRHFVVSFDNAHGFCAAELNVIAYRICRYYSDTYQIVFGVHEDTDNLHIHFAMNTVSYVDGRMYSEGYTDSYMLKNYINHVVREYNGDIA